MIELDIAEARAGIREMRERLARLQRGVPEALGRIVLAEAEAEMATMIPRTPVDHGDLRGSYRVLGPFFEGDIVYATVVCGGPEAPYAYYVHENLEAFHKVGQAKFCASVINEAKRYYAAHVAQRWERDELPKLVR